VLWQRLYFFDLFSFHRRNAALCGSLYGEREISAGKWLIGRKTKPTPDQPCAFAKDAINWSCGEFLGSCSVDCSSHADVDAKCNLRGYNIGLSARFLCCVREILA
jgi:hypothetical protein